MSSVKTLIETLRQRGIADERVLDAIASVDRARFVPPELADQAWDDIALPIGSRQTISQPYIVALMTEALALSGVEAVLEVGTGSGYQAAVLSRLCARLLTIERHADLSAAAGRVLSNLHITNVALRIGDGTLGAPDRSPFDGILVTAGAPEIPENLVAQLNVGGRLVIPVGDENSQELLFVRRTETGIEREHLCDCRFVPLIGKAGWEGRKGEAENRE